MRYFSQLVPGAASRDALPSLQPRPLLFRPGGSGADVPPHLLPVAVMPARENRRAPPSARDAEPLTARTPPPAAMQQTPPMQTPTPRASVAPPVPIRPQPEREFFNRMPAVSSDAPPPIRTASTTRPAAKSTEPAAQQSPRHPPPEPAPLAAPSVPPIPRPYRTDSIAAPPTPSLRIGTLEVRVAAPKTSPQAPARHVPSPARQPARASVQARIARPFATFGFNQS